MNRAVLVVGGGLAGVRASFELLQQRFEVCLVEEGPSVGGEMAELERLFPPDEHPSCTLQPFILELVSNPRATILTSSRVLSLRGAPGDFQVEVATEAGAGEGPAQKTELTVGAVIVTEIQGKGTDKALVQLGAELDGNGRVRPDPDSSHPCLTPRGGIFICSASPGPKQIQELVIRACAAACCAAAFLAPATDSTPSEPAAKRLIPVKITDEPKIAVVIDPDGLDVLDIDELAEYSRTLRGVARVAVSASACDGSQIEELLGSGEFNRLVVAGPSPITHEHIFHRRAEAAGLNRFLVEIVNLNKHCAGVHSQDKTAASEKAKVLMKMAVTRARLLEPLDELRIGVTQSCLVVGGSAAGIACAARLGEMGLRVHLVEKSHDLKQIAGNDHPLVEHQVARLLADDKVELHAPAKVGDVQGRTGQFTVEVLEQAGKTAVEAGAIVIATRTTIEQDPDGKACSEALALKKSEDGLYTSTEGILNLLDTDTAGVFICGPSRAFLSTEEEIVDGEAAASRAACIIASNSMARPPAISKVIDENCDGCAYCVDPCPTRSITLLEFMLRGEIKKVVEVSERTCIGCGICMSTCPKKGADVKHYKLEHFSEMVNAAVASRGNQPVIVSFCCNRCGYPAADAAGLAQIQYPPTILIIRTVCLGMIHPNIIMDGLTQGADGVLLCGCHPGNCRSREGIRKALDRAAAIELMLEDFGLEPERFRLESIAASEGPRFATIVEQMTEELTALGPSPYKQSP
jgi:F420-non-reducing hydrogenase iron-sulfur subunit